MAFRAAHERRVYVIGRGGGTAVIEVCVPAVPSIGTDAGCLRDALYDLPAVKPYRTMMDKLSENSSWVGRLRSVDAAGGNGRFLAHEQGVLVPAEQGHAVWLCSTPGVSIWGPLNSPRTQHEV